MDALTRINEVEPSEAMIVSARRPRSAEKLRAQGFSAAAISGDVRRRSGADHRQDGAYQSCRHRCGAARGLDVGADITRHHDIPHDTESYAHRSAHWQGFGVREPR